VIHIRDVHIAKACQRQAFQNLIAGGTGADNSNFGIADGTLQEVGDSFLTIGLSFVINHKCFPFYWQVAV
jgi:hypothetical protein